MKNNLTPRTYTTPTCTLIVSSKEEEQRSPARQPQPTDFSLHLDSPDGGELDRITLAGQPQQLEYLHQIVSQYIADTIAKFPLPTAPNIPPAPSEPARIEIDKTSPLDRSHPALDIRSSRLGILKNLPGLRNSLAKFVPTTNKNLQSDLDSKPSISKLVGGGNNQIDRTGHPDEIAQDAATTPYLTGTGNRSLDHQLYLGNLATPTSGEVLTLSAIQLFDLATVLEEYVAEHLSASAPHARPATLSRANIPTNGNRAAAGTTAIPMRLPNLPNIPAAPEVSQVYYQTRRSQSSFMSAIPWAVAAALAIGVPLLLLDPNSNPIKDAANKLNMPGLTGSKKSDLKAVKKSDPAAVPDITATAPTVSSPAPWQAQPVSPPPVRSPDPSVKIPENPSQIGLAPLPDAIATNRGTDLPMTAASSDNGKQSIAPNPLNSAPLPSANDPIDNTTRRTTSPPAKVIPSKTPAAQPGLTVTASPNKGANSGKLSVSKRPMLIPSPDLPPIVNPPNSPIPFNPPEMELPSGQNPQTPKKANQKVQPSPVTSRPNRVSPTETGVIPSPSIEPITPIPRNPNLINPDQINTQSADPQNPPIVPDKPLQSNASGAFAEGAESASLQEAKRYFQGKWKPNTTQANSLQYVLQVSGKSGIVRTVSPQGAAATTYLQQTKFIKPGQKLISPAAASSSDQKIRVLLQPDGNVDTFTEP